MAESNQIIIKDMFNEKWNLKVKCNEQGIELASNAIKQGEIVIFPTDTVYGIGCDPYNAKAVEKIYQIKHRESKKPLPVLGYSKEGLSDIAELSDKYEKIISKFWPGPLTIITKIKDERLKKSMNLDDKIAVRVPKNECVLKILKHCKLLVGTSANISNQISFTDPSKFDENLKDFSIFVDGGIISSKGESTIIELDGGDLKIIRQGEITREEVLELIWT